MNDSDNTDIKVPNTPLPDRTVGHAHKTTFREKDGVFKGRQIGYIDQNKIRKPDTVFKGKVVGQIKNGAAYAPDSVFPGEKWGYVDEHNNVRLRDGVFRGRVVGKVYGANKSAALGFFVMQFAKLEERYTLLYDEIQHANHKTRLLHKVQSMLDYVPRANALGDFDSLIDRLKSLEREILREQDRNRERKSYVCSQAETLSYSSEWKTAAERMKALQMDWKTIGPSGNDDDILWKTFRTAQDRFFNRRSEYFKQKEVEREHNKKRKTHLCCQAETLSSSVDWKMAAQALKGLQAEWRAIGSSGNACEDELWGRFRAAQDRFYQRQTKFFEQQARERQTNLREKERICREAEALMHAMDFKAATSRIKDLQAAWKIIGHVPREDADRLWNRFRSACDAVFERARINREQKQAEWSQKMREALERKREQYDRLRESILHDESLIERWQCVICNLRSGGRADEIRSDLESKIDSVQAKICSKRNRISSLAEAIRDIESRM